MQRNAARVPSRSHVHYTLENVSTGSVPAIVVGLPTLYRVSRSATRRCNRCETTVADSSCLAGDSQTIDPSMMQPLLLYERRRSVLPSGAYNYVITSAHTLTIPRYSSVLARPEHRRHDCASYDKAGAKGGREGSLCHCLPRLLGVRLFCSKCALLA